MEHEKTVDEQRLCASLCFCRHFREESGVVWTGFHHPILGSVHQLHLSLQYSHEGEKVKQNVPKLGAALPV